MQAKKLRMIAKARKKMGVSKTQPSISFNLKRGVMCSSRPDCKSSQAVAAIMKVPPKSSVVSGEFTARIIKITRLPCADFLVSDYIMPMCSMFHQSMFSSDKESDQAYKSL